MTLGSVALGASALAAGDAVQGATIYESHLAHILLSMSPIHDALDSEGLGGRLTLGVTCDAEVIGGTEVTRPTGWTPELGVDGVWTPEFGL